MKIYRLKEFKTSQLKKLYLNGNITEEQFKTADEFFKKYSSYEKEIDWNKGLKITWDDLKKVINKERNTKSQAKKKIRKGFEGFKEGKDYLILEETGSYIAYQPFIWEVSRMIASHYVEPSENDDRNVDDAKWCTAYQKDRSYWDDHSKIEAFIYICGESIPTKKVAISISKEKYDASGSEFLYSSGDLNFNIWDFHDHNDTIEEDELIEVVPNLYDLLEKAYDNWLNKMKSVLFPNLILNSDTNRYDYNGNLSSEKLKYFISKNKDGFRIKFGVVTGNFNCSNLNLTSLKGSPQEVGGYVYCRGIHLTSLEGSPKIVGKWFDCSVNNLTSLKGSPQVVGGKFDCSSNKLISLKGAPNIVVGDFLCSYNPNLHSLEGIGEVQGKIYKDF